MASPSYTQKSPLAMTRKKVLLSSRLVSQDSIRAAVEGSTATFRSAERLEEPLNLSTKQPAVVGFGAGVGRSRKPANVATFSN
jgi:hypothetical protein